MKLVFLLFWTLPLAAQLPFGFGLKGGAVRTDDASPPLTIGPYAEFKIPFIASIESGLLLKRYRFPTGTRAVYEIPILLKKRIGPFPVQPFLSVGATLRKVSSSDFKSGFSAAGGLTFNALLVKVEPEFRYSRFPEGSLPVGRNQVEILFGLRF